MPKKERVILIKGDASQWYDQAIFIVNPHMSPENMPKDFVSEAERIIRSYAAQKSSRAYQPHVSKAYAPPAPKPAKAQKKRVDSALNILMALGCLTIAVVLMLGIWG